MLEISSEPAFLKNAAAPMGFFNSSCQRNYTSHIPLPLRGSSEKEELEIIHAMNIDSSIEDLINLKINDLR